MISRSQELKGLITVGVATISVLTGYGVATQPARVADMCLLKNLTTGLGCSAYWDTMCGFQGP